MAKKPVLAPASHRLFLSASAPSVTPLNAGISRGITAHEVLKRFLDKIVEYQSALTCFFISNGLVILINQSGEIRFALLET
jgi:hypothetical protein